MGTVFDVKSLEQVLVENAPELAKNGTLAGLLIELIAAAQMGGQFVNKPGYDYIADRFGRVEVKSTTAVQLQGKCLRIQSYQKKRGRFDYIQIVDAHNNRCFMVPHDKWFAHVGSVEMFWWSASYNETDKVQIENTKFLLKYEVNLNA